MSIKETNSKCPLEDYVFVHTSISVYSKCKSLCVHIDITVTFKSENVYALGTIESIMIIKLPIIMFDCGTASNIILSP